MKPGNAYQNLFLHITYVPPVGFEMNVRTYTSYFQNPSSPFNCMIPKMPYEWCHWKPYSKPSSSLVRFRTESQIQNQAGIRTTAQTNAFPVTGQQVQQLPLHSLSHRPCFPLPSSVLNVECGMLDIGGVPEKAGRRQGKLGSRNTDLSGLLTCSPVLEDAISMSLPYFAILESYVLRGEQ